MCAVSLCSRDEKAAWLWCQRTADVPPHVRSFRSARDAGALRILSTRHERWSSVAKKRRRDREPRVCATIAVFGCAARQRGCRFESRFVSQRQASFGFLRFICRSLSFFCSGCPHVTEHFHGVASRRRKRARALGRDRFISQVEVQIFMAF